LRLFHCSSSRLSALFFFFCSPIKIHPLRRPTQPALILTLNLAGQAQKVRRNFAMPIEIGQIQRHIVPIVCQPARRSLLDQKFDRAEVPAQRCPVQSRVAKFIGRVQKRLLFFLGPALESCQQDLDRFFFGGDAVSAHTKIVPSSSRIKRGRQKHSLAYLNARCPSPCADMSSCFPPLSPQRGSRMRMFAPARPVSTRFLAGLCSRPSERRR